MRVEAASFERRLGAIERACVNPAHGVFGPGSASWELGRDAAIFLGAGCAVLLQLAHPPVACAITQHSCTREDPIRRFHRTFDAVHALVFGELDRALRAARGVHRVHARITGTIDESLGRYRAGQRYDATDIDSLVWVWMTLVHSSVLVHRRVRPELTARLLDRFHDESRTFGELFGIPADALPTSHAALERRFAATVESSMIAVGQSARSLAGFLFSAPGHGARVPLAVLEATTASLLPERIRRGFDMRLGYGRRRLARWVFAAARRDAARGLPRYRELPAAIEARRRVDGVGGEDRMGRLVEGAMLELLRPRADGRR